MRVVFHGVRGSIPTPGPTTMRYGGNTVCVEVRTSDGSLIILDAGTGMRELGRQLLAERFAGPMHLLITHPHWDHILGLPFFGPLYKDDTRMVFHPFNVASQSQARNPVIFDGVHFPVRFDSLPSRLDVGDVVGEELRIGSARITRVALNHPGGADGFRIDDDGDGTSMCYLTDNELNPPSKATTTPAELARFAANTGLLIHDAQYLPSDMPAKRGWGHSLVHDVLDLAKSAGCAAVALHHHEPERDDDALDVIRADAEAWASENAPKTGVIVAREGLEIELPRPR